jgi:uncharacterized membrane protein YbhN (UPF0104 family)
VTETEPGTDHAASDGVPTRLLTPSFVSRGVRVFSTSPGARRFRRASDVIVLIPALLALAVLSVGYPPSRVERSFAAFLDSVPDWLDPLWEFAYDLLSLWAILLVLAAIVSRRHVVTVQAHASIGAAVAVAVVSARLAMGHWPDFDDVVRLRADDASFPVVRVALSAAVILAVSPHLVRPLQRLGGWILVLGVVGATLVEPPTPGASIAALVIGLVAATAVRLASGTSAGHPEPDAVVASLAELGVPVRALEPAARQPAGVFIARGRDERGRPLLVKVYGRDAYDTHLLEKVWRTLWYQSEGPRLRLTRAQAVEHEALLTLLARQAGVASREVVTAGESSSGDAFLVVVDDGRPLAELETVELDDHRLASAWSTVTRLGAAGIAHLRIDGWSLVAMGTEVGVVDFECGTLAPRSDQLLTDRAQLLATTSVLAGPERAIAGAVRALGQDGLAALLPYLQPAALGTALRRSLDDAGVEVDVLRSQAAAAAGVAEPELVKLRRVTWWSLVQVGLLALAATTVLGAIAGLDLEEVASYLEDASWAWVAAAFVVAQLPRVTQAISTLGSVATRLPFFPVYVMQLATGYMNLALPSNFARMAVNIRFFQRQGVPPAAAVTGGAIDSFASTVIQAVLLVGLILFSGASLSLGLEMPSGDSVRLFVVLGVLAASTVLAVVAVRRIRTALRDRLRRWWPEVRAALLGLRAAHKLGQLVGGSLATEVIFATALGMFAKALGSDIGLADLLVINISVSLLSSFVPIPGGIGVAELGLTVGLVSAGMPEEAALATVLLYRVATFYLPPVWGFFAMRWLQRNAYL